MKVSLRMISHSLVYLFLSHLAFQPQVFPARCKDTISSRSKDPKKPIPNQNARLDLSKIEWTVVHTKSLKGILTELIFSQENLLPNVTSSSRFPREQIFSLSEIEFLKSLDQKITEQEPNESQKESLLHIKENDLYLVLGNFYAGEGYRKNDENALNRLILNFKKPFPETYKEVHRKTREYSRETPHAAGKNTIDQVITSTKTEEQNFKQRDIKTERQNIKTTVTESHNQRVTQTKTILTTTIEENIHPLNARTDAINKFAEKIMELFDSSWGLTVTSIPSSKSNQDLIQNNQRFEALFNKLSQFMPHLKVEFPIEIIQSTHATHIRRKLNPETIKMNYIWKGFKDNPPGILFIFDDVLTTGAHFRAMSDFLREKGFNGLTIGIFLSQNISKNT